MKGTFEYLYSTEQDGVKIHMGVNTNGSDFYFILREIGCEIHEKTLRKYQSALANSRNNPKKEHRLLSKIMAESILVDWQGVIDENGDPVEATMENRIQALSEHKKLLYAVMNEASREENFRDIDYDAVEGEEKN